ncbi:alpha-galactosidase [Agromyces cerinus]|uniref:Alpha-galactosidase n=1 Tax=Agromyces cerinus subsp. cerinus TaxID=232089 RepID=A0A1N6E7N4_9MICO|nr:alpha-galactosidase [Agromyces cerinus]SIN79059.1 alpha-galactosidase [Agromyces cerinus subsp. cerinus]
MSLSVVHLTSAGVSLLLRIHSTGLPEVTHWGRALGELTPDELQIACIVAEQVATTSGPAARHALTIVPEHGDGWFGRPGVVGSRDGGAWSPRFTVVETALDGRVLAADDTVSSGAGRVDIRARDDWAALEFDLCIEMEASGIVTMQATIRNTSAAPYRLDALRLVLPVPTYASEGLDFTGRWGNERWPQRFTVGHGVHSRESRRGRTGFDAALLLCAGTPGFTFRHGEVWSMHVGFSGNHEHYLERTSSAAVLGGGELLLPGEVVLATGEEYRSPLVYASYGTGLDGVAARHHASLRARPHHPRSPRPVTLNVWEAVYFDHDFDKLARLATVAADLGVERFVLDDGWFLGRRDDRAGLGDWIPDPAVWPNGLDPLVSLVTELGMQFGIWVEPEMVNVDSDVARAHPDWIMRARDTLPIEGRNQQLLDLTNPAAYEYLRDRLSTLLSDSRIGYLKWDHNRDLVEAGSGRDLTPAVHRQTLATYRLMDELRAAHPGLEIESCSSGGGRVDRGVIEHTDRVWASDNMDPLDRMRIMTGTGLLLPPELIGSHIASPTSHTTGRTHSLPFRAAVALIGHLGIEWDLTTTSPEELAELRGWIERYVGLRQLLHTGEVVNGDRAGQDAVVRGVVAADGSEAFYTIVAAEHGPDSTLRLRLPGLDATSRYRVRAEMPGITEVELAEVDGIGAYGLFSPVPVTLPGSILMASGVEIPALRPETTVLVHLERE